MREELSHRERHSYMGKDKLLSFQQIVDHTQYGVGNCNSEVAQRLFQPFKVAFLSLKTPIVRTFSQGRVSRGAKLDQKHFTT